VCEIQENFDFLGGKLSKQLR